MSLWSWAVDRCQKLLNYQANKTGECGRSSPGFSAQRVILHAGASVAPSTWKQVWWQEDSGSPLSLSLSLCLRCCPLVNERAAATPVLCVRRYKALKASRMAASSLAGPRGAGRRIRHTSCFVFLLRRIPQQRRARVWKEQCQLLLLKLCLCLRIPTGK